MIAKILDKLTGKDDLERVAYKEDLALLNAYLKKRPVFRGRRGFSMPPHLLRRS